MNKPAFEDTLPIDKPAFEDTESIDNGSFLNSPAAQQLGQAITQGPSQMLASIPGLIDYASSKAGDTISQQMQQNGIDPSISNAAGVAVKYAPDVAMAAATPLQVPREAVKAAISPMSRALGLKAINRATPFARGQVAQAAKVALEQGIMPMLANPEDALDAATNLKNVSGKALEEIRNVPTDVNYVFNGLDELRKAVTEGAQTGNEEIHATIDNAQRKLLGLLEKGRDLTHNDIEGVKKAINDSLNYGKDSKGAPALNKKIVANIERSVENLLGVPWGENPAYKALKTKFGAAKMMMMGLNKEIAQQEGNNANGLLGIAGGAAELAAGNPLEAGATMGMMDLFKRRGWGLTANAINAAGNNVPGIGFATSLGLNGVRNSQ